MSEDPGEEHDLGILAFLQKYGWEIDTRQLDSIAADDHEKERFKTLLSWMVAERGNYDRAEVELNALANTPELRGWAQLGLAFTAMRSRELAEATKWLDRAEQNAEGDDVLLSSVLRIQGTTNYHAGKPHEALPLLERALMLLPLGSFTRGRALDALGMWYVSEGNVQAAIDFFEQALDHKKACGDLIGQAVGWGQLGRLYLDWGNLSNAKHCFREDLDICCRVDDRRGEAQMYNYLGIVAIQEGDLETAFGYLSHAIELSRTGNWRLIEGYARKDYAHCLILMDDTDRSVQELELAEALFSAPKFDEGIAHVQRTKGMLYRVTRNWDSAIAELRTSLRFFEQRGLTSEIARTRLQLAKTVSAQGAPLPLIRDEYLRAVHAAEESRRPQLVATADDEFAAIDPRLSARHIYRRVRGRQIDEDATSLTRAEQDTVTVFFFDLQGFTQWSRETDPSIVMLSLNQMMAALLKAIRAHDVQVIEYMGDGFLAMSRGPEHATRAVSAAFELIEALETFNRPRRLLRQPEFACRIGISTGEVVLGNVGTYDKIDFRAVGTTVNLAARIQNEAKTGLPCVSRSTWEVVNRVFEATPDSPSRTSLKGLGQTDLWSIKGPRKE